VAEPGNLTANGLPASVPSHWGASQANHRRGWLLALLAGGVLAIGAEHLYLWHLYFHRVHVIGPLFILNFAVSIPFAAVILVWNSPFSALLAGGFAIATVTAFFWSSLFGLFGYHETLLGRWQVIAAATEVGAALIAAAVLAQRQDHKPPITG
jgi:hypothetical protein